MFCISLRVVCVVAAVLAVGPAHALETSLGRLSVTEVATGLDEPWAVAFLPGGGFLVTERDGRLWRFDPAGNRFEVAGVPEVAGVGQGGLLDVMVPRDFASSREVFLSFSRPQRGGAGTALAVGRLTPGGDALRDVRVIFEAAEGSSGGRHFGSRIVEAADGTIFLTIGDRGDRPSAQDRTNHNGSVIRVNRDGSVPGDNPFADGGGAQPEIWSYGHRNPQGAALAPDGTLWTVEHGARGGDEVNRPQAGRNYGWPVISYGRHYSGMRIGEGTEREGMEQPDFYWDPSIAPSGLMVYDGNLFPEWRGDLFTGSLNSDFISRLSGDPLREAERIQGPETLRVRDVRQAPDGSIWFLSVGNGTLFRAAPG